MRLDHITVGALTLEAGAAYVEGVLGVVMPPGGAHALMGTHNLLMRLGDGVFLEVIAPDPSRRPARRRWFALDDAAMRARLAAGPRIITWVARVESLDEALAGAGARAGEAVGVSRGDLSWRIAVPPDGSMPFDGAFPALIEWPNGPHPSIAMADLGCGLERLRVRHPLAGRIEVLLAEVGDVDRVSFEEAGEVRIEASIITPNGPRKLT